MHKLSPSYLQKPTYGAMSLEPTETRPRSNFPESRVTFPRYNQLLKLNSDETILFWRNRSSTTRSHTYQHHAEITQSHTLAALIRLSTNTHNLLTFNISETLSNNCIPANFFWDISVRFLSWECWDFWRRHDHFRRFPKKSEVFRRRTKSAEGEVI